MSNPQDESALLAALTSHLQSLQPCVNSTLCQLNCPSSGPQHPRCGSPGRRPNLVQKNITQEQTKSKYDYVVRALDIKSAEEVQGFLINPPETKKYTNLKKNLIKAFGKSQTQRDS